MPVKQWLTSILTIAVTLIGAASADAQFDPFNAPRGGRASQPAYGQPPGAPLPGAPFQHAGYFQPQPGGPPAGGSAGSPPGGIPENFGAWPRISPFENRFVEHRLDNNGQWMQEINNSNRRYFAGVSAMMFRLKAPERALFGSEDAFNALGGLANLGANGSRDVFPIGGRSEVSGEQIFNADFTTVGIRGNWGYWDADGTGLEVVGWWASETHENFQTGEGFSRTGVGEAGATVPVLQPDNGSIFLFYDGDFKLTYRQMMINGQINRMLQPIFRWGDAVTVRPMWAARYNFIGEELDFAGTGIGTGTFTPSPTRIHNEINSHLAGPGLGLHTQIGGDILKVTLGSQVIVYANHQRQYLDGYNFGGLGQRTGAQGINNPNDPGIIQAGTTAFENSSFRETRKTMSISPAFEQTVHFEAYTFRLIPWLNRMQFFKDAKLRGGLTYLDIGNVVRPGESIKYKALPLTPQITTTRSKFSVFAWDIGLQFSY